MFLFYTSNERLFRHRIPAKYSESHLPQTLESQVETTTGRKRITNDNLDAIRNRFIEMLVHKTPKQDPRDLERGNNFERHHFIYGTFNRALTLLEKYNVADFYSQYLPAYVISGLSKNLLQMENDICGQACDCQHQQRLEQLKLKYNYQ